MEIKRMYVDTEFTSLSKNGELLSIGIVGDYAALYVEFPENIQKVIDNPSNDNNQWLIENVIKNLIMYNDPKFDDSKPGQNIVRIQSIDEDHTIIYGNIYKKEQFIHVLNLMMEYELESERSSNSIDDYKWQFVSDCCHYDAMLIFDLLMNKSALDMPEYIVPSFIDLDSVLSHVCEYITVTFDVSREALVNIAKNFNPMDIMDDPFYKIINNKHNALYDAVVIKYILESIVLYGMDKFLSKTKNLL